MREDSRRWEQINPSPFAHEQDGLRELAKYLPDRDPYHVWTNVEFVASDGSINEVDALVLTTRGLILLELKHWQGSLSGDGQQWVRRMPGGRLAPTDNPYILANRKAKRLAGVIRHYTAKRPGKSPNIFVDAAVFLHARNFSSTLDAIGRQHVYGLDGGQSGLPSLKGFLLAGPGQGRAMIDASVGRQLVELVKGANIRPSVADRRIGQLILHPKPFAEGTGWQDFLAGHAMDANLVRRVRFYLTSRATEADVPIIKRAAEREFRLLQGIHHPGIAHPVDLVEHSFGPAVIFDHSESSVRLDRWLLQGRATTLAQRLQLVQDLAEIIDYAHSRRLSHRALHPQAIFVTAHERGNPSLVVTDWQTGGRLAGATLLGRLGSSGDGIDLGIFIDDEARRYHAPESALNAQIPGTQLDVFSLGAIAFHILTGRAPADSAQQLVTAVHGQGLDVGAVVDGMPASLVDLVYRATHGDPQQRLDSVKAFRQGLEEVWDELTAPEPEPVTDPLEAKKGDVLEGGLTVVQRLGSGATAIALLVQVDGKERVLKVARDEQHADRFASEARVLETLRDRRVAALVNGPIVVGGRTAILMESAGPVTLIEELRSGRLALELLERYGRDLLDIVAYLEDEGVWHRDIKPANLAVRPLGKNNQRHLCVFDFSLATTPAEQINAGTVHYLDPFLGPPRRMRYDADAERFAAAVTLYEMATGTLPQWGHNANPAAVTDEVTLTAELFDSAVAERFVDFFAQALARDAAERFGGVEEMREAWRQIFLDIPDEPATVEPAGPAMVGPVAVPITPESPVTAAELTARARSVLERLGVHTVGELLAMDLSALIGVRGVTPATRKEISTRVRALRAEIAPATDEQPDVPVPQGIDAVCGLLLPEVNARNSKEITAMRVALGQAATDAGTFLSWPSQAQTAETTGHTQPQISTWQRKHLKKWQDMAALATIRDEIVAVLDTRGLVMSAAELASELIAARGSFTSGPRRLSQAIGLVRAAVEVEQARGGDSRVTIRRSRSCDTVLIGREPDDAESMVQAADLLGYAVTLGQRAIKLAATDPLPTRQRGVELLRTVPVPDGMPRLSDQRLLQLAATASNGEVALSAQAQLYPVGMSAERALRLSAGSLLGQRLSQDAVVARVRSRFPAAEPLPGRPKLTDLLEELGLEWDDKTSTYAQPTVRSLTGTRMQTSVGRLVAPAEVAAVDDKITDTIDRGGFLAVLAGISSVESARRCLLARFELTEVNVTSILLDRLRALGFEWDMIVAADSGQPGDPDFRTLTELVQHEVVPVITAELAMPKPVLITEAAPLARYGQLSVFQQLADHTTVRPAARLILVPARRPEPAMLDNAQLPLASPRSQSLWLPTPWINSPSGRSTAR
ncbi:serine/threonine protein kinase [Nocardia mangyaensis]|uniref:Serine/threonine protein kinase n=1 Tax=Nocardia mangyaensis TaxID=2213200 RepID=A0A1J0VYW3_9NOCA|nr:BREX system serine/threonine kinase PglW [Nocardia mangyaensis]APE37127.1 serine/threonine protein kinase [Nocardia mangyaensis]MBC7299328.1 BREX system serine/threonine kinase PglW [Nocardia sp.]